MDQMLTTIDNPYNPFEDFDNWYRFDVLHHYNSCSLLDRISFTSDELSEDLNQLELERAMKEIVDVNINGKFILVTKDYYNK